MTGSRAAPVLDRPGARADPRAHAAPGSGPRGRGGAGHAIPRGARVPGLDGLRALAVLAVLAFHLAPGLLPGGYIGVDVFFAVSGFLITTLLIREIATSGRLRLGAFWVRRARRLLPALVLVVLAGATLARILGGDLLVDLDRQVAGALTFSTNWREIAAGSSYFAHTAPQLFVTFWSLAVEEQFYLLWPVLLVLLLALVTRRRTRVVTVLLLALASAAAMAVLVVPGADTTRVYYGADTHAFGLMLGAALALAVDGAPAGRPAVASPRWRRSRTLVALAGLAVLLVLARTLHDDATVAYRGGILLASLAAVAVIAGVLGPPGPISALLELRPLRWVGSRSYGIYLWHWPVLLVLVAVLPATVPGSRGDWAVRAGALAVTLALAAATYRWVEQPVRRHGFRASAARVRDALAAPGSRGARVAAGVAAAMVVTTCVAVATATQESATERAIRAGEAALASAPGGAGPAPLGEDGTMPDGQEISAFGDSMMVTSLGGLNARFPGIDIDAASIRQWPEGAAGVRAALAEGTVRRAVVLGYGTNNGVRTEQDERLVRDLVEDLGPRRLVVLVSVYQPSHWVPETNATLARIADDLDNVVLADWAAAVGERTELLQSDRIHPGVAGGRLYAEVIGEALESLVAQRAAAGDGAAASAHPVGPGDAAGA